MKHRGGNADLESQLYASFTLSFLSFALMTEMHVFMGFSSVHDYNISEIHGYFLHFFQGEPEILLLIPSRKWEINLRKMITENLETLSQTTRVYLQLHFIFSNDSPQWCM